MLPKINPIKYKLDDLASRIAEDALQTQSSIERMDAFKLLTNYYVATTKIDTPKKSKEEESDDPNTFEGFRNEVASSGRGQGRS